MILPAPFDAHVHFRQGEMLRNVVKYHDDIFEYALAMPNTTPPICDVVTARDYHAEICSHAENLKPLIALKLLPNQLPGLGDGPVGQGTPIMACKLYPQGLTTNSDDGFSLPDLLGRKQTLYPALEVMQANDLVLCVHGETPGVFCLDRERDFLGILYNIVMDFPKLRIVLEHITTSEAVFLVKKFDNLAATITLHHLMLTLDEVIGGKLQPHHFCKPIPKTPEDRSALMEVILSRHPRFFLGSDSAPHRVIDKCCDQGCAGIFTAPVLMPMLAYMIDGRDILADFSSNLGRRWYRLPEASWNIETYSQEWRVPDIVPGTSLCGIAPFLAGQTIPYSVRRVS